MFWDNWEQKAAMEPAAGDADATAPFVVELLHPAATMAPKRMNAIRRMCAFG